MKLGLSNSKDHDLFTHSNRFKDLKESLERIKTAISSYIWLLTFRLKALREQQKKCWTLFSWGYLSLYLVWAQNNSVTNFQDENYFSFKEYDETIILTSKRWIFFYQKKKMIFLRDHIKWKYYWCFFIMEKILFIKII